MASRDKWFDDAGQAVLWDNIPLRTVKRAVFRSGDSIRSLTKMILNSVTYDFTKTAQNGAVIVPPGTRVCEFVSPDGRIDHAHLIDGTFGEALSTMVGALEENPVPAWDQFASWAASSGWVGQAWENAESCHILTVEESPHAVEIGIPNMSNFSNMATLLRSVYDAAEPLHNEPLIYYQVDDAAFAFIVVASFGVDEEGNESNYTLGFLFRE